MNRLARIAVLVTVALGMLIPVSRCPLVAPRSAQWQPSRVPDTTSSWS
jgi:hypothetical protein